MGKNRHLTPFITNLVGITLTNDVLAASAKQRKETISFVQSAYLCVRPSIRLFACNNLNTAGWISLKYNKAHEHSCWITKATNRQPVHVILITFPWQKWLRESVSIRRYKHIGCLVTYKDRNGYCFNVCRFYMNCTALRHTCHSNAFI